MLSDRGENRIDVYFLAYEFYQVLSYDIKKHRRFYINGPRDVILLCKIMHKPLRNLIIGLIKF